MSREGVFWGWGEPGAGPSLPDHAAGFLRSALGVEGPVVSTPVALEEVRMRAAGAVRRGRAKRLAAIVGRGTCATTRRRASPRCRGKSYLDLLRQRAGDCEDAPDAGSRRATRARCSRRSTPAARTGSRWCPTAAARAWSGAWSRCAGRFGALISLDLGRLEGLLSFDERSQHGVAGRPGRGCRRPTRPSAQRGYTLGHTPPELRVGDGRGLRRHALGGPVLDRATGGSRTTSWRCGARRRPASSRRWRCPRPRPGRRSSSS